MNIGKEGIKEQKQNKNKTKNGRKNTPCYREFIRKRNKKVPDQIGGKEDENKERRQRR